MPVQSGQSTKASPPLPLQRRLYAIIESCCLDRQTWIPSRGTIAVALHTAVYYVLWITGAAIGLRNGAHAVREMLIGNVVLLLFLVADKHESLFIRVILGCILTQHSVLVLANVSVLSDDVVYYGAAAFACLAVYQRCPYLGFGGLYSFGTKVIDHHRAILDALAPSSAIYPRDRLHDEILKLAIVVAAYVAIFGIVIITGCDGSRGGFSCACGPNRHARISSSSSSSTAVSV